MKVVLYVLGVLLVVLGIGEIAFVSRFGVLNQPGILFVIGGLIVVWIGTRFRKRQATDEKDSIIG